MSQTPRRSSTHKTLAGLAAALCMSCAAIVAPQAAEGIKGYKPVTDERLANPEPENWLSYRGNYAGWGYSPLDKINADNVKRLVPAWTLSTGVMDGHQSPPIVNNGIMFISTPQAQVLAVNARDGQVLWRYQKDLPPELFQLHPTNRGVGLYGDKVYVASTDACVTALEAATGKVVWSKCVAKWKDGYYITLSPLVARGKIVVGVSGGEFGIRGFISALDSETGDEKWKTFTVAGPEDPGFSTWKGDAWKTGGAPVWIQGNYDDKTETAYFGTGNGGPWMPDTRPGDNLYSTSTVALDINTGKIKGHHQYHYNDAWDWDEVSAPLLIDVKKDGRTIPSLVHAGRNGYLWTLERTKDGPIKFVDAKPFVYQDVFSGVDPKTGRPIYKEDKIPQTGKKAEFCPSLWGGKDWPPEAYNPKTGLLYIPANDNLCAVIAGVAVKARKPGELYIGVPVEEILSSLHIRKDIDVSKPVNIGALQAWDMNTGKKVWQHDFQDSANWGPVLTTGSGLVFAGGTSDRKFRAFDGKTGKVLWEMRLNSGVIGVPSSFMVDGTQYVSVQSGWGVDADRMLGGINSALPEDRRVRMAPQGGVVWVFKVMDQEVSAK